MGSLSTDPLIMLILSEVKAMCWMFWCNSIGVFSFLDGNLLNLSASIISFPGLYIEVCNHTSVIVVTFFVTWRVQNHLKRFVVTVDCDVSPIVVSMKFLQSRNY